MAIAKAGSHSHRFEAEGITTDSIGHLDDAALIKLGAISLGARLKIRLAACAVGFTAI